MVLVALRNALFAVFGPLRVGLTTWTEEGRRQLADDLRGRVQRRHGKFTKPEALYTPRTPFVVPVAYRYECDTCTLFQPPDKCEVVEGTIAPKGWCALWAAKTQEKPFAWLNTERTTEV